MRPTFIIKKEPKVNANVMYTCVECLERVYPTCCRATQHLEYALKTLMRFQSEQLPQYILYIQMCQNTLRIHQIYGRQTLKVRYSFVFLMDFSSSAPTHLDLSPPYFNAPLKYT